MEVPQLKARTQSTVLAKGKTSDGPPEHPKATGAPVLPRWGGHSVPRVLDSPVFLRASMATLPAAGEELERRAAARIGLVSTWHEFGPLS